MHGVSKTAPRKIPAISLGSWIIKIAGTTLGETGGDTLSMTPELGYAVSTGIFFAFFLATVIPQIRAQNLIAHFCIGL